MCMGVLPEYIYPSCIWRDKKNTSDSLELELQTAAVWALGTEFRSSGRAAAEPSLQAPDLLFRKTKMQSLEWGTHRGLGEGGACGQPASLSGLGVDSVCGQPVYNYFHLQHRVSE